MKSVLLLLFAVLLASAGVATQTTKTTTKPTTKPTTITTTKPTPAPFVIA